MRTGVKMGDATLQDSMVTDGLTDASLGYHMGITGEFNLIEDAVCSRDHSWRLTAWMSIISRECGKAVEGQSKGAGSVCRPIPEQNGGGAESWPL